jgi:hypothetical protein
MNATISISIFKASGKINPSLGQKGSNLFLEIVIFEG